MTVLIVAVALAWIAILMLGLAVGGLLGQVRALEARLSRRRAGSATVVPRLAGSVAEGVPSGAFSAAFVHSTCDVCHRAIPELLAGLDGGTLLIVTDELPPQWRPLPPNVRAVIDPQAAERSGVPAVPWFAAVDADGHTIESFALGNPQSIERATQITHDVSATDATASQPSLNH